MPADLTPLHHDLTFMSPLSEQRADRLARFVAAGLSEPGALVVDIGCGWGELLLRTLAAAPTARGLGLDLDAEAVAHGTATAAARGLADRVELVAGDAKEHLPDAVDAVICIGASQIWGPAVEEKQPLDYAGALAAIRALVSPGARVVFGDAIWSQEPTAQATAPLTGRPDEFVPLARLVELAVDARFAPVRVHEANQDEWDEFETGFSAAYAHWLATHPTDHPDAQAVRDRARAQREGYFSGYRGYFGMAYLELLAV
ncbi:Methyltransferase type 12 [Beutenbergia cavernae DSM 12333]|uniref:Methyltransferase type 12 n=1 Tax=Beutenbergia cavernae (strain ATCC BAA-8 / DSM 12333 / CCUG 43141 / JCM 11478 / NBRC 16432 / NCIMB 13614 / HKI 0122) TaxID=471853 RepID=C5C0E7_BEUC1|nr:methyltransferase domain-containing protein [Beutenbergia cavernae]ACQ79333.1 Methyltransferase type 12 [Beutenbergia cavernae DSM 12333]